MAFHITVLYDNEAGGNNVQGDWGFSALIEAEGGATVLFDTGADGRILLHNATALGVSLREVSAIVISHWHWDHSGGLPVVLRECPDAHLFVPLVASEHVPEEQLHVVGPDPVEIAPGVHSTGVLDGIEQSLVLETGQGGCVLMGCAHPGVGNLLRAAATITRPAVLLGGLHGFSELSLLEDLDAVYPCHCTQRKREILARYPAKARPCAAGVVLNV